MQAPFKVDLPGDMTYQYTWVPMLQGAHRLHAGGIPGGGQEWLDKLQGAGAAVHGPRQELDFRFVAGQRPQPNNEGPHPDDDGMGPQADARTTSTSSPARRRTAKRCPTSTKASRQADLKDPQRAEAIYKVIRARLAKAQQERPFGYLVRHAPAEDVKNLQQLAGHLTRGLVHHQVPQDLRPR